MREPKLGTDDKPIKIGKNIQYEFIKQKIDDIETIRSEKKKAVLDKNSDFVIPFVSPFWTFEWCILRSELLGSLFKEVLKNVHSDTFTSCSSEMEWEIGLAKLLLSKSLQKTQLAYELSEEIKKMQTISFKKDDSFYYIAAAIKHACKNGN